MQLFFDGWATIGRTILAGVVSYVLLVALLRASGKRTLSKMNAFDFVVTIALGSTLATILVSRDLSIATGFSGLATLVAMQYVVAWLSVRSRMVRRFSRSEPRLLLHRGQLLEEAMRAERVNRDEIVSAVRKSGMADITDAAAVVLETDGTFSVLPSIDNGSASTLRAVRGYDRVSDG